MKLLLLLLGVATLALGQALPEPVLTRIGDNHAVFCTDKDTGTGIVNIRMTRSDDATWTTAEWESCQYAANGCTKGYAGTGNQANFDDKPTACIWATDLKPNTAYLVHINFWDGAAWTSDTNATYQTNIQASSVCAGFPSNCTDIDADGGGAGTDRVLQITTTNVSPSAPDDPVAPTHARTVPTALPAIDNEVSVTVTGGGECDVQAKLTSQVNACIAAATSAVVYAVKLPSTSTGANACRPEEETAGALYGYEIPDITDTDCTFVFYSESPDTDVDPPYGGLIAEDAATGSLVRNKTLPTNVELLKVAGSGDQNIYLDNFILRQPPAIETDYTEEVLTDRSMNGNKPVISLTNDLSTDSWPTLFSVYFPDAESRVYRTGLRQTNDNAASTWSRTAANTWQFIGDLNPGETSATSTTDGVASVDVTKQITSATAGSQPTLTFASNLNYASGFEYTLTSVSSGTVTVDVGTHNDQLYSAGNFFREALLIEGASGDAGCNGIHTVTGANMSSRTWTITDSGLSCTGGTGQILLKGYLHNLSGYTQTEMTCLFSVETQTTAKIYECMTTTVDAAFTPDFTGMTVTGWMAFAPGVQQPLLSLGSSAGVTVTSVLLDLGGPPWIHSTGVAASGENQTNKHIFSGNRIVGGRHYQPTDPASGHASAGNRVNNYNIFSAYSCQGCIDNRWINTHLESCENFLLSGNGLTVEYPKDLTIDGLTYTQPTDCYSSDSNHGGKHTNSRQQPFEFKNGGARIHMNGLWVDNQHVAVTKQTAAILCQQQPASASDVKVYELGCFDFTVQNSFFRGNQFIYLKTISSTASTGSYAPHGPLKIHNNFIQPRVVVSKPSGDTGYLDAYLDTFIPTLIALGAGTRDIQITDNTYAWRVAGANSTQDYNRFVDLTGDVQPPVFTAAASISGNAYVDMDSDNSNLNALGIDSSFTWANYEAHFQADGAFSTSGTHSGNRTIPATISPNTHDFVSTNAAHTEVTSRLTAAGGSMSTNWPPPASSADSQSANTRLDFVFDAGGWTNGAEGADIDLILDAVGVVRGVSFSSITSSTASLEYTAPASDSVCHVIYKAAPITTFSGETGVTALAPSSSLKTRTASFTGLAPDTTYDVQIQCNKGERTWASFTTN